MKSKPIGPTTAISMIQLNVKIIEKEASHLEGRWEENDFSFLEGKSKPK